MFPDSYFATVLGWFTVLMLGLTLYNVYVEEKGRTLIFLLAAFFGGFGWFYAKTRAQSSVLLTPEPAPSIIAAAEPPAPVWCEESPTKNCALDACLASIKDGKPTFVLMEAKWCGPCHTVSFYIRRLDKPKETLAKFRNVRIDVDANPGVAELYPHRGTVPAAYILGKSCEVTHSYVGDEGILHFFKYPPVTG